jgi:hypothetical protein
LWSIIAVICFCLGGCDSLNPVSPQAPLALPPELSIEEHALKSMPSMDESEAFEPVESTQEEILSKHQVERSQRFSDRPLPPEPTISLGGDQYYWCCSAAALNPRSAKNMVAFFAQPGGVRYYVEIGVSIKRRPNRVVFNIKGNHYRPVMAVARPYCTKGLDEIESVASFK